VPVPYRPTSDEDRIMYATWQDGVAGGSEPSGAELARAAGRPNDDSGVGRRAARRYREAHATDRQTTRQADDAVAVIRRSTVDPAAPSPTTSDRTNGHRPAIPEAAA